jgi:hypothetical protein
MSQHKITFIRVVVSDGVTDYTCTRTEDFRWVLGPVYPRTLKFLTALNDLARAHDGYAPESKESK